MIRQTFERNLIQTVIEGIFTQTLGWLVITRSPAASRGSNIPVALYITISLESLSISAALCILIVITEHPIWLEQKEHAPLRSEGPCATTLHFFSSCIPNFALVIFFCFLWFFCTVLVILIQRNFVDFSRNNCVEEERASRESSTAHWFPWAVRSPWVNLSREVQTGNRLLNFPWDFRLIKWKYSSWRNATFAVSSSSEESDRALSLLWSFFQPSERNAGWNSASPPSAALTSCVLEK